MTFVPRPPPFPEPPPGHLALDQVFGRRLREARERRGLTQEQVAVKAGIDEMSASVRISQYENGRHLPRYQIAVRLAFGLGVPVAYLYTPDDATAEMLLWWHGIPQAQRAAVLARLPALVALAPNLPPRP